MKRSSKSEIRNSKQDTSSKFDFGAVRILGELDRGCVEDQPQQAASRTRARIIPRVRSKRRGFLRLVFDTAAVRSRILALAFVFLTLPSLAATNVSAGDDIPKLRPPRPELPPTFWEKYEIWVILGSIAVLALIGVIVWLATRPKPPVIIPPEVRAKQALDLLLIKPEDGLILSQVSQIIRHYVTEAFGLPPGEQTTAEFCRLTRTHERIGPELSSAIADFLRRCDERKFVASPPTAPMGAVATALKLVETAQMRLAELRRQSELTSAQ